MIVKDDGNGTKIDNRFKQFIDRPELENFVNVYFVKAYSAFGDFNYYISKNSKFILDEYDGYFDLTPNTENMNNKKIKRYYSFDKTKYGGDFRKLNSDNLVKLIVDLYNDNDGTT